MQPEIGQLLSLDGRHTLVTGGATGIGEAIAVVLAAAGATVTIGDIDLAGAQRVADEIGGTAVELDVTDPASADAAVAARPDLDLLVNNAGTYLEAGSILDQTHESWRRSIDVNLAGVFNCSKPAATAMVEGGRRGSIVNIASVDGFLPCLGTGYDSAKAAVIHLDEVAGRGPGPARHPGQRHRPGQRAGADPAQDPLRRAATAVASRLIDHRPDGTDDAATQRQHPPRPTRYARKRSPTPSSTSPPPLPPMSPATP